MEKTVKRKSIVWEFFKWMDIGNSQEVCCDICDYKTKICPIQKSTSTMLHHVRSKHHEQLEYVEGLINNSDTSCEINTSLNGSKNHCEGNDSNVNPSNNMAAHMNGIDKNDNSFVDDFRTWHTLFDEPLSPSKKRKQQPVVIVHDFEGFKAEAESFKRQKTLGKRVKKGDERKSDMVGFPGPSEGSVGSVGENQGTSDDISIPLSPEQFMSEEPEPGVSVGGGKSCSGPSPHSNPQRPESYKLRHNNHLTLVLESLAGDESFMDVTLTAQGKAIKAHKSVLSAVSPYFRSVLKANPCQHPIIIMPRDIRFEELNNIISYIYKGEMTVAASDLSSLLKTAEVLQVTGLSPSETNSGIMSQVHGFPASTRVPNNNSNVSSHSYSKKQSQKQNQNTQQQQQQQPQQQQQQMEQDDDDDDDDDDTMNEDTNDSQGRVDPLEFLNTDMTCVKEEVRSEDEAEEDNGGQQNLPANTSNLSPSRNEREPDSVIPNIQNQLTSGSPKPVEDIISKPFNPGENDGSANEPLYQDQTGPASFVCIYCFETHRPIEMLQSHLRLKHPSKPAFICGCGKVYGRSSTFADHSKKCKF